MKTKHLECFRKPSKTALKSAGPLTGPEWTRTLTLKEPHKQKYLKYFRKSSKTALKSAGPLTGPEWTRTLALKEPHKQKYLKCFRKSSKTALKSAGPLTGLEWTLTLVLTEPLAQLNYSLSILSYAIMKFQYISERIWYIPWFLDCSHRTAEHYQSTPCRAFYDEMGEINRFESGVLRMYLVSGKLMIRPDSNAFISAISW